MTNPISRGGSTGGVGGKGGAGSKKNLLIAYLRQQLPLLTKVGSSIIRDSVKDRIGKEFKDNPKNVIDSLSELIHDVYQRYENSGREFDPGAAEQNQDLFGLVVFSKMLAELSISSEVIKALPDKDRAKGIHVLGNFLSALDQAEAKHAAQEEQETGTIPTSGLITEEMKRDLSLLKVGLNKGASDSVKQEIKALKTNLTEGYRGTRAQKAAAEAWMRNLSPELQRELSGKSKKKGIKESGEVPDETKPADDYEAEQADYENLTDRDDS